MMRKLVAFLFCLAVFTNISGQDLRSEKIVSIDGKKYYLHKVLPKETLYSLARTYNIAIEDITGNNNLTGGLKIDETIKIPFREEEKVAVSGSFKRHRVTRGDTLYSIAKKYGVSVDVIIADNPGIDISALKIGSRLYIRRSEMGETETSHIEKQIEDYATDISNLSDEYIFHVALAGETLYSLSRRYEVSVDEISGVNNINNGIVKAGTVIRIPKKIKYEEVLALEDIEEQEDDMTSDVEIGRYKGGVMNIAMLLPLTDSSTGAVRGSFMEFYQGALLALEDLKQEGRSISFNLYNTEDSAYKVSQIVEQDEEFAKSDLIIGPVYERNSDAVVRFARKHGVVMVSPLASIANGYGNIFYQMAPAQEYKNDKLKEYFCEGKRIIFISAGAKDRALEQEMLALVGNLPYITINYTSDVMLEDYLVRGVENMYVVTSANETDTDKVLAAISSMHNNRLARSMTDAPIKVIGNSRWLRYPNIEKNLFFKLDVSLVTSYHSDISNPVIKQFDNRYLKSFGSFPTLYSYRGYDAVKMFADAYFESYDENIASVLSNRISPLQVPYRFVYDDGKYVNDQWTLLNYKSDYNIIIK